MTAIVNTAGLSGGEPPQPRPTFTWYQAKQSGLTTHTIYKLAEPLWVMTVSYHLQAGTPRHEWEPIPLTGHVLSTKVNHEIGEQLELGCREALDPLIRQIADRGEEIDTLVQTLAERDPKLTSAETGIVYTEDEAVTQVESNQAAITADKKRGHSHHQRVPGWLRVLGKVMPYGEALGLLVLLAFWLNVQWTRPQADWLTWSLSMIIVLATLLLTPRLVERAGEGWNKRREAAAQGQTEARRMATGRIVINGTFATLISLAIVAGLIERALAVTDETMPESMLVLLLALCAIAGLAMPAVAFLATAWDGSSLSREDDDLVAQLADGLEEDGQLRGEATSLDLACRPAELQINTVAAPALLRRADEDVEEMRRAHAWLRVQIGGLPAAPPDRPTESRTGIELTSIPTGIPGAEPIRLEPLVSRGLRLHELHQRRTETMARLHALPPHPWSGNHEAL